MKEYGGEEVEFHESLNSALDGDEWSASFSGRFFPWETATGTH